MRQELGGRDDLAVGRGQIMKPPGRAGSFTTAAESR
jgi:hypothetical protein